MGHDFTVSLAAFYLSFVLRYGTSTPGLFMDYFWPWAWIFIGFIQLSIFYFGGLYKGLWRYSSTPDLIRILRATTIAVLATLLFSFLLMRLGGFPRSIFFINWLLLVVFLGGGRLVYRIYRDFEQYGRLQNKKSDRVVIVGAGAGGERLLRELKRDDGLRLHVVGFADDSPGLQNRTLLDVPILGTTYDLAKIIQKMKVKRVFIAIPSASSREIRRIYSSIKNFKIEIKILPRISEILQGDINYKKLEAIKIEDLLGREEVRLDLGPIKQMLEGKRVLVTGAGGSIGSELCEQLARFNPANLMAVDLSELNTYELEHRLKQNFPALNFHGLVSDVRDLDAMDNLFEKLRPEVVLHAAAYKHVPLMEFNPYECIRTNVLGTKTIAELSVKYKAERFVLVSTDKAVNPTNVMGATKRIAEMLIQNLNVPNNETKLISVRFGNVLGSSGSVIPLFRKQISEGGPITVTHEEITRYFMSIPEATKLVLQAGSIGEGGELFVLDMGEPIKIIDLAKEMISLAGLHEGIDLDIVITGLRPGEKLYEEPLLSAEKSLPTPHPKVKICQARSVAVNFPVLIDDLLKLPQTTSRETFLKNIKAIVPEYVPFGLQESLVENDENQERIH